MTTIDRAMAFRRALGFIAIGVALAACDGASIPSLTPTASSGPTSTPIETSVPAGLDLVIATSEATTLGLNHDYTETGRSALTFVVRSGRNADFAALDGFIAGHLAGFNGEAGALISAAFAFDTGAHAQTALDLFLDELSSEAGYAFGVGELAGLGHAGVCDSGPNPHLNGLVENICIWRNASLVLIAGGPISMADIRAIATAMDSRADRLAANSAGVCRGADVDWSALPPVAQAWGKAWNERDDAARLRLLEEAWADTGDYADPTVGARVVGREAVSDEIGRFMQPGDYFEPRDWLASDEHHGYMQLHWNYCSSDGFQFDGVDFVELAPDGRIQRVTDFFAVEPAQPRAICAPPVGDWTGIPDIARKWAATTVSDPTTRRALLREVFTADGSYVDPSDEEPVVGYEALDARVSGMLWEGAFFEAAAWTDGDSHHDYLRLRWRLCDQDVPGLEGVDFVELNDAGKFVRVIGFFPWP
jgi:hypothetical protein